MAAAVRSKSIPELRRICAEAEAFVVVTRCMAAFSAVGDMDDAYGIIDKEYPQRVGRTPAETERIWLDDPEMAPPEFITSPAAAPMRRDPRYLAVAQRVGLLDYWRSGWFPTSAASVPSRFAGNCSTIADRLLNYGPYPRPLLNFCYCSS